MAIRERKAKGITLISLVVTIVVLLILASVTISVLFGDNGIITMAQKARMEWKKASRNEEKELTGIFEKNFSDYNGALSVKEGKLVNQYGDQIRLTGLVSSPLLRYSVHYNGEKTFSYYINEQSISALKSWGINVMRIGLEIGEVQGLEKMEDLFNTIDLCIRNDLYVIVLFWNNQDINENIDEAKQYFSELSERYSNSPNVIYEIANEPNIDWNHIKDYCNIIMPIIRQNSASSVIIVPNPTLCREPDVVVLNDLDYIDNVMTSYHMYAGNLLTKNNIESLQSAMESNIPVFVTEWGSTLSNGNDGVYPEFSNAFVKLMDNYNLSWCYFELTDYNYMTGYNLDEYLEYCGIVKHNQWNNNLSDDILSESGKYIKSILMNTNESYNNSDYAIMMERDDNYAFWKEDYINKITEIEFKKENEIPNNAIINWDISLIKDNSVLAYILQEDENYKLYIISRNTINLPTLCGAVYKENGLFQGFERLKSINFDNVNVTNVSDLSRCFMDCTSLETVKGIENWNTCNVHWTSDMFRNCTSLKSLNLTNWNTKNLENTICMFSNCQNLKEVGNIKNWNTKNLQYSASMFAQTYSIEEIDLSNWVTINLSRTEKMFNNCGAKTIRIDNFDLSKVSNIQNMFFRTSNLENLYLNNVKFDLSSITNYENSFVGMKNNVNIYVKNLETAKFINNMIKEGNIVVNLYYKNNNAWDLYGE